MAKTLQCVRFFLSCTLCKGTYQDSRILSCGHSFCVKCIVKEYQDAEKMKCNNCQELFQMPSGGFEMLPKNHAVDGATVFLDGDDDPTHQRSWCTSVNAILAYCQNCFCFR